MLPSVDDVYGIASNRSRREYENSMYGNLLLVTIIGLPILLSIGVIFPIPSIVMLLCYSYYSILWIILLLLYRGLLSRQLDYMFYAMFSICKFFDVYIRE